MSPTSGATPSHRPKMKDVWTDVRRLGLSPPSTSEVRKLSRLRVNPRVTSPITCGPPALAVEAGALTLQVRSYPLLPRGQASDPSVGRNLETTETLWRQASPGQRRPESDR